MATSTFYSILQAVQTEVKAVVPNTVIRRKLLKLETDLATLPIVYLVPMIPPGEKWKELTFNKNVVYEYPVLIVYVAAGAKDMITGLDTFLATREAIRNACFMPILTGDSTIWDNDFDPDPILKFAELLGGDYDVCGWKFLYYSKETRS